MAGKRGGRTSTSGQGRPKGVPNKITRDLKEMILGALDRAGGVAYLTRQAKENPAAFLTLVGKIIPLTVKGDGTGTPIVLQMVERRIVKPEAIEGAVEVQPARLTYDA